MTGAEIIQVALGLIAVGGIGGIWFRLGSLTAKHDAIQRQHDGLAGRVSKIEERMFHA